MFKLTQSALRGSVGTVGDMRPNQGPCCTMLRLFLRLFFVVSAQVAPERTTFVVPLFRLAGARAVKALPDGPARHPPLGAVAQRWVPLSVNLGAVAARVTAVGAVVTLALGAAAADAVPGSPELVTTTDPKHQLAANQHRHQVERRTRRVRGGVEVTNARKMVQK